MAGLFTEASGNLTPEQIKEIAKRGGKLKANEKSPEEKTYMVIFKYWKLVLGSQVAENEMEITGECIISTGRHNMFDKIKEYLDEDGGMDVDLVKSMVLVEGVDAGNAVSLYRFLQLCNKSYADEAFDEDIIKQYLEGFNEEHLGNTNQVSPNAVGTGNYGGTLLRED